MKATAAIVAQPGGLGLRLTPGWVRVAIILLAVVAWEIAGHTIFDPEFISPPSAIIAALPRVLADPAIRHAILVSFYELVAAFGIATLAGIVLGVPIGLHRFTLRSALPLVLLIYSIPQVTVLPLFILYFGIGPASKIAFGVSHGIFPILLNVVAGAQTVEPAHLKAARSMGAGRLLIFRRVVLPHMVPSLFSGLRLGMSATLLGVILAELYGSQAGIGYYTQVFTNSFDPAGMFALVAVLAVMAIVLNEIVRRAERRASFWRVSSR
jgi:ABC-type nitrate/sulfonate/bicarbonate transport system permease component